MADLSDVENALVAFVANVVHPGGASGITTIRAPCEISRGWPNKVKLDAALNGGNVMVTVYAVPGTEKLTSRFQREWQAVLPQATSLTATVSGNAVTIGGANSASAQVVAIVVNDVAYTYVVQPADTLNSIALAIAALVPGTSVPYGSVVYFAIPSQLKARVSGIGSVMRETRRQERAVQISLWCPTPALRDSLALLVDAAFAQISLLTMPDTSAANIKYVRTLTSDAEQNENLYRRDLVYAVEYATTQTIAAYGVAIMPLTLVQESGGPTSNPIF